MENDIVLHTVSYLTFRVVLLIVLGYAVYHCLRPARIMVRTKSRPYATRRAESVRDDRC